MTVTAEQAQSDRERLIATYIADPSYSGADTQAAAFLTLL